MGKPSNRPGREEQKRLRQERRQAQAVLRQQQAAAGLAPRKRENASNATCPYKTTAEEKAARADAVIGQTQIIRGRLKDLLWRLARIKDPRDPRKIRHKHTVLLIYGILMFVYQLASRREANQTVTRPAFKEKLQELFPELESMPHGDTLYRLLDRLDVEQLEAAHLAMIRHLIRGKKFARYLVANGYPIAIDGTQKWASYAMKSAECLERTVGKDEKARTQYYAYVLEASLAFPNGLTVPLLSEFLSHADGDPATNKQDCEQKAFHRLAKRLKEAFPRLAIMLLLDGLYPNGPIMARCREYGWQFMIVLQDKSLPSVWADFKGLRELEPEQELTQNWGNRRQRFRWANQIEYEYEVGHKRKRMFLHLVICDEKWWEINKATNAREEKRVRHAWVSSEPLNRPNVHERCNLGARHRWGIEAGFLVEKRHGYQYEHCFAESWNAMKGYHLLMHMARLFNVLVEFSERVGNMARQLGMGAFVHFVRETIGGLWLDALEVRRRLAKGEQLRLI